MPRASPGSRARCRPRRPPTGSRGARHRLLRDPDRLEVLRQPARCRQGHLCGEESFGTGSNHVREKDGLWAVLLWLDILAARRQPVARDRARPLGALRPQLLLAPRLRGDRRARPRAGLMAALRERAAAAARASGFGDLVVEQADDFSYQDPVDGSLSEQPGHPASCSRAAPGSSTGCPAPAPRARRCGSISRPTSPIRPATTRTRRPRSRR